MAKATYHKQLVVRLYKEPYDDVKALSNDMGETEAEFIRIAINRYIAYLKKHLKEKSQS